MKSHSSFKSRSSEDFRSKQPFELQSQNISLSDTNFHRGPFPMSVDIKTFNPRGDKLVHDDGGFDYLPPLNLGQCLPSFFNNPSYTFLRGDASSTSSTSNLVSNERLSTDSSGDNQSQVPIISQKSPHHHHHHHKTLKSNISLLDDISEVSLPKSDKESKSDSNAKSDSEAKSVMNMKSDNIKRLLEDFKSKTLDDFTNILHNEKDELLSAIERKVDRELVDRLFDKIRLLIQNLSDRINEVSKSTEGLATQDDLLILTKAVKTAITSPKKDGDSACVKECLLCGRTRTGVSGHISAKEAKRVGEASVMTAQSGGKMLYGDGAAFYGNSLESLPRFRLPKLSNEHSK
ncbi:hypothetical protein GPJ56_003850 [Histomonas meleagridis]|uniref:uncharacterized protein n=1 Tax=Histomonas meleagridis TaxID=135588 RepID=UPI00355987F9|nr:hypothetical protein GPJ56_003850 [Histomonas meleagridis]KAH0805309.1 hypothetical protein GO595_002254 [Histomonas meleagridis]